VHQLVNPHEILEVQRCPSPVRLSCGLKGGRPVGNIFGAEEGRNILHTPKKKNTKERVRNHPGGVIGTGLCGGKTRK